jgi:hypothetical protein
MRLGYGRKDHFLNETIDGHEVSAAASPAYSAPPEGDAGALFVLVFVVRVRPDSSTSTRHDHDESYRGDR